MSEVIYHDTIIAGWVTLLVLGISLLCSKVPNLPVYDSYIRSRRILGVAYIVFWNMHRPVFNIQPQSHGSVSRNRTAVIIFLYRGHTFCNVVYLYARQGVSFEPSCQDRYGRLCAVSHNRMDRSFSQQPYCGHDFAHNGIRMVLWRRQYHVCPFRKDLQDGRQ